jgi:D-beta-D-heptose 7-phosphate kinase/D-beta-D-heptose 1-phosphate adenosyltransferase
LKIIVDTDKLAGSLKNTRILVVGDLMLDRYLWGDASRVSPEAPVPVVKVEKKTWFLGGAGNVAVNLSALGCETVLMGITGRDWAGERLRELFSAARIEDATLMDDTRPTTTKTRVMARQQQMVRLDEEDSRPISEDMEEKLLAAVAQTLPRLNGVILSDYGKGIFHSEDFTRKLIQMSRDVGVPVFVDPKGSDWRRYTGATCVTPNTLEMEGVVGKRLADKAALEPEAGGLREKFDLDWLLVTRGAKGMALFGRQTDPVYLSANAREVFDVSGAGDTVIAVLTATLSTGMPFADAAGVANTAAGIVVGKLGTQPVLWEELARGLAAGNGAGGPASKVTGLSSARIALADWRRKGYTIVFTNGCFDLLHPGHVSLLHQARRLGHKLVVGLNTDASIKRLKGENRPILPGEDRGAVLSGLADVDLIVFFDEDTPLNLIRALKPDILVKGADYTLETVVGREIVESYGGKVQLVDILEGHSTTRIAEKLSGGSS